MADIPDLPHADPDLQATVTDFADYTEYYPSDLVRSLTLIRKLDETYQQSTNDIHRWTKQYSVLPSLPAEGRPDAQELRAKISKALATALRCRENSRAEAARLCNLTENLSTRLHSIREKLEAQPRPPARDVTPPPSRTRKTEADRTPRIKLVHDGELKKRSGRTGRLPRRQIIVPGEVLPPRDPNSPSPSQLSDSEPERSSPVVRFPPKPMRLDKEKTPKPPKLEKEKLPKIPKVPRPRTPGMVGTNAHSQKVGISVSNAMAQLGPRPENPVPGSRHAPWGQLSEYELLAVRKRMKKNADWIPSYGMVQGILKEGGRLPEDYEAAKQLAEENGEEVLNEEPLAFVRPIVGRDRSSEPTRTAEQEAKLVERGMRLNETKKMKAQQRAEEKLQATISGVLADPSVPESSEVTASEVMTPAAEDASTKNSKKRKRGAQEADNEDEAVLDMKPKPGKKIKFKPAAPAAPEEDSLDPVDDQSKRPASMSRGRSPQQPDIEAPKSGRKKGARPTVNAATVKASGTSLVEAQGSRPRSRGTIKLNVPHKKAASSEPEKPRISLRRTSDAGPPNKSDARIMQQNTETAASRRGKRGMVPGVLTSHDDEPGARTSISRRKTAPIKKEVKGEVDDAQAFAGLPAIDPDEPVYCYCRNISHGQMIACENAECETEWFHVECVGLLDISKTTRLSRLTWYCHDCRGEFQCDQETGIVQK